MSFASQRHVRELAYDPQRGCLWAATWGGVGCWDIMTQRYTRHTSEHGLIGNATRSITVDRTGMVWAAAENGGVAILPANPEASWQPHLDLKRRQVLHLAARPYQGVIVILQEDDGRCTLGEISVPDASFRLLARGGIACRSVAALLVDESGAIWTGNAWGLHRYEGERQPDSFDIDGAQVRALVSGGGFLWAGTNRGIYRFHLGDEPGWHREPDWPRDHVISLAIDAADSVWGGTIREVGKIIGDQWQPVKVAPPGRFNTLLITTEEGRQQVWCGGPNGIYEINRDTSHQIVPPILEDGLSNAVQTICAEEGAVWVGTPRGLFRYKDRRWTSYATEVPELRDVRAIVPIKDDRLLIADWRGGLRQLERRLDRGLYVPDQSLVDSLVALVLGPDDILWAATVDEVYTQTAGGWKPLEHSARRTIGAAVIQTLCVQQADRLIIWVGTSDGLLFYQPEIGLWDRAPDEFGAQSIQALAIDPFTNHLWIGTSSGLYSEQDWCRRRDMDIQAIAFDDVATGALWLGTTAGLERWPVPGAGEVFDAEPMGQYSAINSGLAADLVTALSVRAANGAREVWVGSPVGVSCLQYDV